MFKQSVSGLCNEFTSKLEVIREQKAAELIKIDDAVGVLQQKITNLDEKANEAELESIAANNAIHNIKELFGVK